MEQRYRAEVLRGGMVRAVGLAGMVAGAVVASACVGGSGGVRPVPGATRGTAKADEIRTGVAEADRSATTAPGTTPWPTSATTGVIGSVGSMIPYTVADSIRRSEYVVEARLVFVGSRRFNTPDGEAPVGQVYTDTNGAWLSYFPVRFEMVNAIASRSGHWPDGFVSWIDNELFPKDMGDILGIYMPTAEPGFGWPDNAVWASAIRRETIHEQPLGMLFAGTRTRDWMEPRFQYPIEWGAELSVGGLEYEAINIDDWYEYSGTDALHLRPSRTISQEALRAEVARLWDG